MSGLEEVLERQRARNDVGLCACGCGRLLKGKSARTRYFRSGCRQAAYRERLQAGMEANGVRAAWTFEALDALNRTTVRHGDADRASRRPQRRIREGVQVYLATLEIAEGLAAALEDLDDPYAAHALESLTAAIARRRRRAAS